MGKREDLRTKPYQRLHVTPLPRMRIMQPYDDSSVTPRLSPNCLSAHSEGSNRLVPSRNDGWREWAWEDKNYWVSDEPISKADFNFTTVLGTVKLFYLRSKTFRLGNIACWVDDDDHKAVTLIGYWEMTGTRIRDDLAPGEHTMHCELLRATNDPSRGHEFRIISLMSI